MTRKHYIKKFRYLRWSLSQLPCNENLHYRDIYWSILQKNIPTPSELGCSYDEMLAAREIYENCCEPEQLETEWEDFLDEFDGPYCFFEIVTVE